MGMGEVEVNWVHVREVGNRWAEQQSPSFDSSSSFFLFGRLLYESSLQSSLTASRPE